MDKRDRYERKTVKVVRGTDRLIVAKWEKRGWELVDQTPGAVRNELTFRRPKPLAKQPLVIGAAVAVVALVIITGVLTERDDDKSPRSADSSTSTATATPVEIVKNRSYSSDDLLDATASVGFTCPSPTLSGGTQESAPTFAYNCANGRTVISLGGTITGADPGKVFILSLDDEAEFANGPWLVGPDWALHGPGVENAQESLGGKLLRRPTREALQSAY